MASSSDLEPRARLLCLIGLVRIFLCKYIILLQSSSSSLVSPTFYKNKFLDLCWNYVQKWSLIVACRAARAYSIQL